MSEVFTQVEEPSHEPFRSVCRFWVERRKFVSTPENVSTGFLIGSHHILTAAHNFAAFGVWPLGSKVKNATARFGASNDYEYLDVPGFYSGLKYRYPGRYGAYRYRYDYCLLTTRNPISGIEGFSLPQPDEHAFEVGTVVHTAGYPDGCKPMMQATGRITEVGEHLITYDIDTEGGLSGAPVWTIGVEGRPLVVGVHVMGAGKKGSARKIDDEMFRNLQNWGYGND